MATQVLMATNLHFYQKVKHFLNMSVFNYKSYNMHHLEKQEIKESIITRVAIFLFLESKINKNGKRNPIPVSIQTKNNIKLY